MESKLNIPSVDLSLLRRYSLAELEDIDFSTSDDFAIVVENLKNVITLEQNIEEFWTEDHEQVLWQFVIDPESNVLTVYFSEDSLVVECAIPKVQVLELFYIIKVVPDKLISSDYNSKLLYGTTKAPFFESLYQTLCSVYLPMFSRSGEWSKCIKTDYLDHLSKFLLELFDLRNKLQKEIVFYVPDQISDRDVKSVVEQKELLNQVERTVMKWIWLFMCVLMQRGNNSSEDSGPLEEIEFWELKCNDLKKVLYQLERDDVKICIEILKAAKLTSYFKFMEVSNQLQSQFDMAQNNLKFLSILRKPCKEIGTAALCEIPNHLGRLLDLVRIIWNNSPYLKDPSEISNLLCKVNNFVIKTVSSHIPLEEIFQDKTSAQKQNLSDVISCCNKWIEIFEFSEKVHKRFAPSVWSVQEISPQINLFVHRCEELIQVCEYKDEFSCEENIEIYSPGQKCYEIAEQLEAIQTSFWNYLYELDENKQVVLHIRSATWYEYFKKFKLQINELEISISKLMLNAFENLNTIEEGLQILKMFQKHFKKQVIKRDLRRCVKTLYDIFLKELNHVQEKLTELKTLDTLPLPQYGGTAFRASILPQRVKQFYKTLQEASQMWPRECDVGIKTHYERVIESNREFIHTLFLQWTKTIPKDPYTWLKEPIFVKQEGTPFLKLNLSSEILNLIQELYYWDKTGVEIPQHVVHLLEKGDVFHKRIMKMLESVKNYNRIVKSLSSEDKEIFADILATIEEGVKPVLSNLNWAVPLSSIKSSLKVLTDQTKSARETFVLYDANKAKIEKQCDEIGRKSLFISDITEPYGYEDFLQVQVAFREKIIQEVAELVKAEIYEANQICNIFKKKKSEISLIPAAFSAMFLNSVSSALTECFTSSLKSVASLVGINREDKIRMILKLSLHLQNHQMCFAPNIKELCLEFEKLVNEMEASLCQLMVFEETLIGDVDAKERFLEDVRNSETVQGLKQEIDFGLYLLYKAEKNYKSEWNSYSCLWETSKIDILKRYQERGWNAIEFETDINRFLEIGKNVLLIPRYTALEFCLVDCQQLKDSAAACAEEWKTELGSILSQISCSNLQNAFDLFELTAAKFKEDPCNLQQLKHCINFLISTKKYSYEIQSTFKSIDLNFEVLNRIGIHISEKSLDQKRNLYSMWEKLQNNFENYYIKLQKIQAEHQRHFLAYHKQLERHTNNLEEELFKQGPFQLKCTFTSALSLIAHYQNILLQLQEKESLMKKDAIFFHITLKCLEKLISIENDLSHLRLAWSYVKQLDDYLDNWGNVPIIGFDVQSMKKLSDDLQDNTELLLSKVKGTHWILLEELLDKFNNLNQNYEMILNFQEPTLQERHWNDLKDLLGITCEDSEEFFKSDQFTFTFLRNLDIENLAEDVKRISIQARKEFEIEQTIKEIQKTWQHINFKMSDYEKFHKLEDTESIVSLVERHQITLGTMKASKYVSYFSSTVDSLEDSLLLILDVIKQADYFQSKFFLLENIFAEQAVQAQLPKEASEVQELTDMWRDISSMMNDEKLVWSICHKQGFLDRLIGMNKVLEEVQQSLEFYLDSKRRAFPRFYFLSNDDLLSIIGEKNPEAIQSHLKKCFDSICQLKIVEKVEEKLRERIVTVMATGMYSAFKEYVEFKNSVMLDGPVESWLSDIEEMMQITLYTSLPKCLQILYSIISKEEFNFSTVKWLNNWPTQVCILSILIAWTTEVTTAIKVVQETAVTTPLKNLRKRWRDILNQFVLKLQNEAEVLMQKKTMMMILALVHSCEIIDSLIAYVCNDPDAFEWLVHLRYYLDEERESCLIRQAKSVFKYGFEYLGNRERLVITPVTNRCVLSLTTALYLNKGATLKGCRSSGKTETLKDLGITLGKYTLIINCSENLDHRSLVRMFSGLAQIGAWGLFEDYNCIKEEIISVLSQQVNTILLALAEKKSVFSFFGNDIHLHEGCGIFFSENPDFPSRTSEFSTSFRPVTIILPDVFTVIQVYLFAYGFKDAKAMATDIKAVFSMAKDQLSKHEHYEFGLKTIINFLKHAGKQKRFNPKLTDLEVIVVSLRNIIIPKLESSDIHLFESLLETVLGTVKGISEDTSKFVEDIKRVLQKCSLQPESPIVKKVNELHEIKEYYHGIILVGESGSGKSTSWQTLKETYIYLHEANDAEYPSVNIYSFNPKAYTLSELYGNFSEDGIWVDGLFSSVLKEANEDVRAGERWIILNGSVDASWIESISSLLDSNKVLTTANGERIMLSSEVLLIFESTDLIHCSPNIVSHCGIIYHDSSTVNWKMYMLSWLQKLESSIICKALEKIFDKYLDSIFDYCLTTLKSIPNVTALNMISSFIKILDTFLKKILSDKIETVKLSRIFWISLIWSFGAMLNEEDRFLFDTHIKSLDESLEHLPLVFDYNLDENLEWIRWTSFLNNKLKPRPRIHFENVLIPTVATVSYQSITQLLLQEMKPVLLIGKNGCGKTIIGSDLLYENETKDYLSATINFSPQVSSLLLQQILERQLDKKAGGLLLPRIGKRMLVFLDDIDQGKTDKFGSQSSLELLYMILDGAFWYGREKWTLNHLQNLSFLASAKFPYSYHNKIPTPILNRFNIINVLPPQEPQMKHIFMSLLKQRFSDSNIEIRRTLNAISLGCMAIYDGARKLFLPVPSKLHYVFGLKDVKKVLYRILDIDPEVFHDKTALTKFWFHECIREFSDRFVNAAEKEEFFNMLEDVTDKEFLIKMKDHFKDPQEIKFLKTRDADKGYDEMKDTIFLRDFFERQVDEMRKAENSFSNKFVLFENNINHLCHIIRGIENSHGNMILLGATGTGKRSLSRLAAFILNYKVFEMNLEISYGIQEFKKDLCSILYDTGVKNKKMVFLLSDDQINEDMFLHLLSDILTVGVPLDIFISDELKMMYSEISESSGSFRDFVQNIQQNLHIILCINYSSPLYRKCFLKYPALYKKCTIDWFNKWPQEALETIAHKFLLDVDLKPTNEERLGTCCKFLSDMHMSAMTHSQNSSSVYGISFETSSTFIKLTNTFKKVLAKRQEIVEKALRRLTSGLEKIHETQEKVNEIARETKQAQEELKIAERECDEALKDIILKKAILAEKQESIQEKKIEIEKKEKVCKRITIAAEEDLNAALPALEEARKALEALNKRDIGEIKSYAKPPALVEMVLEAVMILRNSEPSWAEAKRQLGNPSFLKELFAYDRDNISDAALAKIGKYVKNPQFQPDIVGKVSFAAKSLCIWVRAMHVYGEIYKKVKPKMERLRIAKEELERLQKTLADLLRELEELEASIRRLEEEHSRLIEKKEELARKERELALKLKRAESIIEGLSSEKDRWQKKVLLLSEKRNFVIGDSFLASGYLTYLGPHDQSHRAFLGKRWKRKVSETMFTCSETFDLADFFVEEEVKNEWKMNGLPTDQYSNEGAAIVTESYYYPFIVDPEGQAMKWIKNMETKRKIKAVDFQDSKWTLAVEAAILQGFPVLLQNVNPGLDSSLSNLLKQSFNKEFIHFNNKKLKIEESFRLYMLTMTINPQFTSTAIYLTAVVNFTIKEKGLEDQLLPLIVLNERSDLEMRKEKLVKTIQDCKKQLWEIEDTVLKLLSTSTGSLLDDEVLVEALQKSKTVSVEVEEKLSSSEKTETIIDSARDKYRPCAKMASILYFVLTDMADVDRMYVFTLDSYITLFLNSISKSPRDSEVTRRILKLNVFHQRAVYKFACRTIIEKHALLLAFHICTKISLVEGKLDKSEYDFFIKGGQVVDRSNEPTNPCSQWLSQESWDNITQLERLPRFLSITVSFDENSRMWQEWYLTLEPEKRPLPGIWRNVCSGFQMLLIIRCLRLDRLTNCITNLVNGNLGKSFLEYPEIEMREVFNESSPNKPLVLFTVSSDTNPEKIIENLAKNLEIKYRAISLGKGQENAASQLIIDSAKVGYWVFISNCHLLLNWLPALEKFVNKLQSIKVHEKFRLWLGSAPTKHFPTSVLQNSIIVSLDFPKKRNILSLRLPRLFALFIHKEDSLLSEMMKEMMNRLFVPLTSLIVFLLIPISILKMGIRANMLKLYEDTLTEEDINTSTCQTKYKCLLFSMAFFHSVLLGRKRFQNLGWNLDYNFTNEDFKASSKLLKLYLDEYKDTQWNALKTMIAESIYGSHIADLNDERLLMFYYDQFFCDEICANIKHRLTSVPDYYIPEDGPLETYVRFIEGLPSLDAPEVFGQHCNAEIPYRVEDAKEILDNMMKIKGEHFAVKSNESQLAKVISDLKLRVPDLIDEMGALDILQERPDYYNEILVQETKRYNILLKLVSKSLNELEASIFGKIMINSELEELSKVILKMEVPEEWQKVYPTLKPLGSWIQDLRLRVEQFTRWISIGAMPVKIWLSGFSSPNSVLNATLQTTVKNSDVMLKELIWEYHVSTLDESHIVEVPIEGIYVRGLLLEGAGWDKTNGILIEPEPLHLITTMPVILFKPVIETSVRGVYNCPCYYTSKKTDDKGYTSYLFNVDLKTKKAKDYWVKRGTCLLLSAK